MCPALREIDGQKLKAIVDASHTASVVMTYLSLRQRNTAFTDIDRLKMDLIRDKERVNDEEHIAMWKALDELGVGTYVKGRGVNRSVFHWNYSLKTIASAAVTGQNVTVSDKIVQKPKKEKETEASETKSAKSDKPKVAKVVSMRDLKGRIRTVGISGEKSADKNKESHDPNTRVLHVHLHSGFMVEMRIPLNFSREDAQRLCQSLNHVAS